MRSRLFSSAPSLRIELSSRCSLKRYCCWYYFGILIPCSTGPPHDGTRQQDQVGWSEGGPHIVKPAHICHLRAGKAPDKKKMK